MEKHKDNKSYKIESRWPVILTIAVVTLVLSLMRARIRLLPYWATYIFAVSLLLPMLGVALSRSKRMWLRMENLTTLAMAVIIEISALVTIFYLIYEMVMHPHDVNGRMLLSSSVGGWMVNILTFSLIYWRIDRGGPEPRANNKDRKPDWLFPQTGVPEEAPAHWHPTYVDYLFLSFSTATAFSTTEVAPMTHRSKLLMMLQAAISMTILVIVASRAINIIGSE